MYGHYGIIKIMTFLLRPLLHHTAPSLHPLDCIGVFLGVSKVCSLLWQRHIHRYQSSPRATLPR